MNKIFIQNLHQKNQHDFTIEDTFEIFKGFPDILGIQNITAVGTSKYTPNRLSLNLEIKCTLKMIRQKDLEEVNVPLDFILDISFGDINECDYPLEDVIEIDPIIIGNILAEAPYSI